MKFLELVLENFGPYIGKQTINLRPEITPQTQPIILLGGMNGGGKTTLMDAIRLALYGSRAQCSTRGNLSYGDFLTQCVNRHAKPYENTRIELAIEHVDSGNLVEYRIVRTWMRNPKDGKDSLGILTHGALNDEWKDDGLTNTWDEHIEKLLPLGISSLFLFDGEQVKELAELEAPPPVVYEAIQNLLGLELPARLAADLEILLQRKRKQVASIQQLANIEEIEAKLKTQQAELDAATEKLTELEQQRERAEKQQKRASDKFILEGGKIAGERHQLDRELDTAKDNVSLLRKNLRELAETSLPLGLIEPLLQQSKEQAERERNIARSRIIRDAILQRDRRLLDYLSQLKIPDSKTEKIITFLETENQQLEVSDEPPILELDDEILDRLQFILTQDLPAQIELAKQHRDKLEKAELEVEAKERQLNAAAPPEVYEKLKNAVMETQKNFAKVQTQYEAARRHRDELDRAIAKTKKELSKYSEKSIESKNANHIIQASAKVKETLKLFREKLTLKKLNKLEIEVTECFRYLLHKSDLVHRIAIDAHNFRLSLYDPQGQPVPKHRLSAGEKQLLAIAFLWGLARVSGRQLPVAIDTPLGRLDSSHRQNLVERYFPAASHQVILLSTDTEIGKVEYEQLQEQEAIARSYLLKYDSKQQQTTIESGYFWSN
ncbi:MAG TPA: DNA sulfur modification protein DndD [Oscillatoriales cyanobacterium M59_W2019_021]|nr:MAG: DNA sulfur modification protein DndD [Cyanobacteria bacterium J055]HIK33016.1 DNA sulfur modification protein DndD [Oscillatoriales cyanobacterium M4454_W2019_049]HIK52021.1 DNA sulfur modification protein DndD [Oscillatoriales cyanobacterium M59_W2019_021]